MKKIALVLSGGGFKGAFQLGALKSLQKDWHLLNVDNEVMKFDIVSGVSVGALNGLMVASNRLNELEKFWADIRINGVNEIYHSDIIDTKPDHGNLNPKLKIKISWEAIRKIFPETTKHLLWRVFFRRKYLINAFVKEFSKIKSLAENKPLEDKLKDLAIKDYIKNCIFTCGYVSLDNGKYYSTRHDEFINDSDFAKGVLASTVMPIVWSPINEINTNIGKHTNVLDGGVRNVSPLRDAIKLINEDTSGAEYTIIIINCSSGNVLNEDFSHKNIAQIALRALDDISISEVFNNDITEFLDKNFILEQVKQFNPNVTIYDYDQENQMSGKALKYFKTILIQPSDNVLGDSIVANDVLIDRRIKHGKYIAEKALLEFHRKNHQNEEISV